MPLHVGKGRNISTAISDIIDYVENPQKTDFGKFIYGYECDTLGLREIGTRDHHIGNGYFMNDYIMGMEVENK